MEGPLNYNNKKVEEGVASIVGTYNIPGHDNIRDINKAFNWYEMGNIRSTNVSFQLTINPDPANPKEVYTDQEIMNYAKEVMDELGYADQPIAIYKHEDIERTHYHLLSIRVNAEGKKINDYNEQYRLQAIAAKLAAKYHYDLAGQEEKKKKEERKKTEKYNPGATDVRQQMNDLFDKALEWKFTTNTQFVTVMKSMNVDTTIIGEEGARLILQGLDDHGEKSGVRIDQKELGRDMYAEMTERAKQCSEMKPTYEEKKQKGRDTFRIRGIMEKCMEYSKSEKHLEKMLAKKGLYITLSRGTDGKIFGVTVADVKSKTVYKASEIGKEVGKDKFMELEAKWDRFKPNLEDAKTLASLQGLYAGVEALESAIDADKALKEEEQKYIDLAVNTLGDMLGIIEDSDRVREDSYARRNKKKRGRVNKGRRSR